MKNQPLVSIIMSSYNNERDVKKAIDSVINQSYANWELVISDDASVDTTKSIIDSYTDDRIKRFHSQNNQGIVKQMNMLFSKAQGDFITILDADDMIAPEKLALQLKAFETNPNLTLCFGRVAICDEQDQILKIVDYYPEDDQGIRKFIFERSAFPCGNIACMMFKQESLKKHGGYHLLFDGLGSWDIDLALRIISDGAGDRGEIVTLPHVIHYWRKHPFSFSRKVNLNPMRSQSHQFAHLLYKQRLKHGKDDLTGLDSDELKELIQSITQEYKNDPSRILREICNSKDLPKKVRINYGLQALRIDPTSFTNYRYLVKALFSS